MHIILLSGGSGKRLWPLSNDVRSKQFIKIFRNKSGRYASMVQRVYKQIETVLPGADITIATSKSQLSSIRNQLGDAVSISVEPCRRDTFPAIVLSAVYLADVKKTSLDEPVIVCPVDPLVENDYFAAFEQLCEQVVKAEANLVLMGIEPTYPSEKYGYIIPANNNDVSAVKNFKEKPSADIAREYIEQGALWNGGVFAFKLQYLLDKAHKLIDFIDYYDLLRKYEGLKKISFDYAVVEQESRIQVTRFAGKWKDIGTWNTFTEAMDDEYIGNVITNGECKNVHVLNELDIPILVMGLKDAVISASPEGILVSDKEKSAYIKPYVENIAQEIMFADKSWGSYRVINVESNSLTVLVTLNSGHSMNYHSHEHRDEIWNVISGYGHVIIDDEMRNIQAGDIVKMPAKCKHTVFADTELKLIEVQLGESINVSDKVKHDFKPDTECFGGSDIRGIYPTQVNKELAYRIGRYFKVILCQDDALSCQNKARHWRVAVGNDIRLSGPDLKKAVIRGLTDSGCDVVDVGQCGTEMIYFATSYLGLDGGIMVTASHNPKTYNGFKLVGREAMPIFRDNGLKKLEWLCNEVPTEVKEVAGNIEKYDIISEYVEKLLEYIDVKKMQRTSVELGRKLRVVVNAGNGAAGDILPALLGKLPCEFIKVNDNPDGNFPNGVPNPLLPENREATASIVRKYKADMGVAWDGDFDRCFIFDEKGNMVEGAYMVGFLAEAFLRKMPGAKIVHDPRVFWNTQDICRKFGGESILCRSGHAFIKAKMREVDAVYGGEMSAHHYFKDFAYCDSGMIPWLLVLELVQQEKRTISEILAERIRLFPCSGEINSKVENLERASKVFEKLEKKYADGKIDYIDGLSVAYSDWRFNVRRSSTENVIRLNVESCTDKCLLDEKTRMLLNIIRS